MIQALIARATGGRRASGRPPVLVLIGAVLATMLPQPGVTALAFGAPIAYQRADRIFNGVPMRTRGFLQDNCIQIVDYPCLSYDNTAYRAEGTAQARAIQQLSFIHDHSVAPLQDVNQSKVHWEVSPDPDDTWGPGGPPDLNDPDCPATGRWRIDVVVDKSAQEVASDAYEVKDWSVGRAAPRAQLSCYLKRADAAHIPMVEGTELTGWVRSYPDWSGQTWCVWGDQVDGADPSSGPGLIFFSRITDTTIPAFVRNNPFGGCRAPVDPLPARCAQANNGQTCFELTAALALLMLIALAAENSGKADAPEGTGVPEGGRPLARPFAQLADPQHLTQFTVRVVPDPTQPETVLMDYGDGAEDTATVYPGSGVQTLTFSHVFQPGFGFAIQRAIVLETAQESDVFSAEDADAIPPVLIGLPNPPACTSFGSTIAAGSLAVGTDGSVWSWNTGQRTPAPVPGLHGITSVATGDVTNFAIRADGSLWAWGNNTNGQLGTGAVNSFDAPVLVGVLGVVAAAGSKSGEGYNGVAIKADGSLWAWGGNDSGQLGAGTTNRVYAPVPAKNVTNALAASTGHRHTMAVDSGGNVWGTGDNLSMQLGLDQTVIGVDEPQVVLGGALPSIGAGEDHTVVLGSDGSVWNWGYKDQLGRPVSGDEAGPGPVPGLGNAVAVDAGGKYEVAMLGDGTLRTWGEDDSGVIGDGHNVVWPYTPVYRSPQSVTGISSAIAVSAGFAMMLAQLSDGTLWAWGDNRNEALGTASTADASSTPAPVQISNVALPGGCQPPSARPRQATSSPRAVAARRALGLRGWNLTAHWRRLPARSAAPRQPARTTPAPARVHGG